MYDLAPTSAWPTYRTAIRRRAATSKRRAIAASAGDRGAARARPFCAWNARLNAADYAHRAALGADPMGYNPPYSLHVRSLTVLLIALKVVANALYDFRHDSSEMGVSAGEAGGK
jgi:hypothetical protein